MSNRPARHSRVLPALPHARLPRRVGVHRLAAAAQVHRAGRRDGDPARAALVRARRTWSGAIPTSLIVGKLFRGIDLREHGSRNLGATNVYRVLGWKYAVPVALFDIAQGRDPGAAVRARGSRPSPVVGAAVGIAAIVGHVFSVFVGLQGRQGRRHGGRRDARAHAGGAGRGRGWSWVLIVWLTGYVSLGSIVARGGTPVAVYFVIEPATPGDGLDRCAGGARRSSGSTARTFERLLERHREPLRPSRRDASRLMRIARAGRGKLGHDAGQPAGAEGRGRSASGPTRPRWWRRSTGAREPAVPAGRAARARRCARRAMRRRRCRAPT